MYAVEGDVSVGRELKELADTRSNLIPIINDPRYPGISFYSFSICLTSSFILHPSAFCLLSSFFLLRSSFFLMRVFRCIQNRGTMPG